MEMVVKEKRDGLGVRSLKFFTPDKYHKYYTKEAIVLSIAAWNLSSVMTWIQATLTLWSTTGKALATGAFQKLLAGLAALKVMCEAAIEAILIGT